MSLTNQWLTDTHGHTYTSVTIISSAIADLTNKNNVTVYCLSTGPMN